MVDPIFKLKQFRLETMLFTVYYTASPKLILINKYTYSQAL